MAWATSSQRVEEVKTLSVFQDRVLDSLRKIVAQKAKDLAALARSKTKGRIATSIKVKDVDNEYGIKGLVFTKWYIARFYEIGYGGKTVRVKAHTRRVRSKDVREKITDAKGRRRSKIVQKGKGEVSAHDRTIPKVYKPFLDVALEEMRNDIRSALAAAIGEASRGLK